MKIIAYTTTTQPCIIRPANLKRSWMDAATNKFPYRCLPLSMANGWGWEALSSAKFTAEWDGSNMSPDGVKITVMDGFSAPTAHFGQATITWHLGYVFKTPYPYGLFVTGPPNCAKPNVTPLSGIVETHWVPFTFTMNWQFSQAGSFSMEIGEPFCQLFPVDMNIFDGVEAEIRSLHEPEPETKEFYDDYWQWNAARCEFLHAQRTGANAPGLWQKNYTQGKYALSTSVSNISANQCPVSVNSDSANQCPVHTSNVTDTNTTDKKSVAEHRTKPNVPLFVDKQIGTFKQPDWFKELYDRWVNSKKPKSNTSIDTSTTNNAASVESTNTHE